MCVHTKLLLRLPAEAETFWQRVKSSPKPSNDCCLLAVWIAASCQAHYDSISSLQARL